MIKNIGKNNKGYAILETIFYIALFAILSISVIDAMIIMTKAFKEVTIQTELMRNGNIMERISREIRQAHNINSINTTSLKLDTTDDVGADRTVEFSLSGSDIRFSENDVFMQINTAKGMAVKVILTVKSNRDSLNRNESFYNTIVLRGSY